MSERVAVVTSSYPRQVGDPSGHFVHSEVLQLAAAGHDVHVFAPGRGEGSADGVHVHWLRDFGAFGWPGASARLAEKPTRWLGVAAFAVFAQRAMRRYGPFARLQAHFLVPVAWPIATLALPRSLATPFEVIGHGSDVRLFCRLPRVLQKHVALAWLGRGARIRLTSSELARDLRAACPELSTAIDVAVSPIQIGSVVSKAEARRTLAIDGATELALIVSRLVPEKRVGLALSALELIDRLSVIVVGDGPELAPLSARFPNVRFVGCVPRPQALRFIAAADVLVSASDREGAPSVVREARALGVPVVSVAAGDLPSWAERDPGLLLATFEAEPR